MAFIFGRGDGRLDFDALIVSIGRLHPGTAVTVPDYWADRIARSTATALAEGWPVPNPALTCSVLLAEEQGLQRQVAVPIREGLTLTGRVGRDGLMLMSGGFSAAEVGPLLALLAAAGLSVELSGAR